MGIRAAPSHGISNLHFLNQDSIKVSQSTITMAQPDGSGSLYQLYYNPFSICSLFVLYTFELKGKPKTRSDTVEPERCFVDIYLNEQMSEAYLDKNPKGQVDLLFLWDHLPPSNTSSFARLGS